MTGIAFSFFVLTFPSAVFAHETHIYRIGNQYYKFVVGSLNEPITVDDATGVDLRVNLSLGPHVTEAGHGHESEEVPVEGLDQSLKVELKAADKTKTLDLRPKFGAPGSYTAKFYPTIQTTYTYRFFGNINDIPIDLSFSCNPAGHPQTEDDTSEVAISDNIVRTFKRGAFGCPTAKADMGFPEQSTSLQELNTKSQDFEPMVSGARKQANFGILAGILGLAAGGWALFKIRQSR